MEKKSAELIVKVLAILGFISAGFAALFGLLFMFGGTFLAGILPVEELPQLVGALAGAFFVVMGIVMIIVGVLQFFIAKGLWDHKNWARIVCIIFSSLGILAGLFSLPSGIFAIVVHGLIVYFLGFEKTAKKLFK